MTVADAATDELEEAREVLVAELREHALVIGEVTLGTSVAWMAQYYVDAKRAILRPEGFVGAGPHWWRRMSLSGAAPPLWGA